MRVINSDEARVWNASVRPLVDEALRCYNVGAVRAAIAATWVAVTTDLIEKIAMLADDGDRRAVEFRRKVDQARLQGVTPAGAKAMQRVEDDVLGVAEELELFDSVGRLDLNRIREDRNLCVHPSLRHLGELYDPRPETARAHLGVALSTVLTLPPTQGRRMLNAFTIALLSPIYALSAAHLEKTFFDQVHTATRRNIVQIAAKHALCELAVPEGSDLTPASLADRMAEALTVFAARDRALARDIVRELIPRFRAQDGEVHLRVLVRLGAEDFWWETLDEAMMQQIAAHIEALPGGDDLTFPQDSLAVLALAGADECRRRMPSLAARFSLLPDWVKAQVVALRPSRHFVDTVIDLVKSAPSYRAAEDIGQRVVLPHGQYLTAPDLSRLLTAWADNRQCREAGKMPGIAVDLVTETRHLGDARREAWGSFLTDVRSALTDTDDDEYRSRYGYHGAEDALSS